MRVCVAALRLDEEADQAKERHVKIGRGKNLYNECKEHSSMSPQRSFFVFLRAGITGWNNGTKESSCKKRLRLATTKLEMQTFTRFFLVEEKQKGAKY